MIEIVNSSVVIDANGISMAEEARAKGVDIEAARKNSLSARILAAHNIGKEDDVLRIRFVAMASHDIT